MLHRGFLLIRQSSFKLSLQLNHCGFQNHRALLFFLYNETVSKLKKMCRKISLMYQGCSGICLKLKNSSNWYLLIPKWAWGCVLSTPKHTHCAESPHGKGSECRPPLNPKHPRSLQTIPSKGFLLFPCSTPFWGFYTHTDGCTAGRVKMRREKKVYLPTQATLQFVSVTSLLSSHVTNINCFTKNFRR